MSSLRMLLSLHFWSRSASISISSADLSVHKWPDSGPASPSEADKQVYARSRGTLSKSKRSKNMINLFENHVYNDQDGVLQVVFEDERRVVVLTMQGVVVDVMLDNLLEVDSVHVDKSSYIFFQNLMSRLSGPFDSCASSDRLVVVSDLHSSMFIRTKSESGKVWSNYDHLLPPSGRRLGRRVVFNSEQPSLLAVFWSGLSVSVAPWQPEIDDVMANVVIISVGEEGCKRVAHYKASSEPLHVDFLSKASRRVFPVTNHQPTLLFIGLLNPRVDDKSSRMGMSTAVEILLLTMDSNRRQLKLLTRQVVNLGLNLISSAKVDDRLLLIGGSDNSLALHDCALNRRDAYTKSWVRPDNIAVHPGQALFVVANQRGQIQVFDIALNPISLFFAHIPSSSFPTVDLSLYFTSATSLIHVEFGKKPVNNNWPILLRFQNGPLVMAKITCGSLFSSSFSASHLTGAYLRQGQFDSALLLLSRLDWNTKGAQLASSINSMFHQLLTRTNKRSKTSIIETEKLMEMCLGLYFAPNKVIHAETEAEFDGLLGDLCRKYFFLLLRYGHLEKAYKLAMELDEGYDLFVDLHHEALERKQTKLASMAMAKDKLCFVFMFVQAKLLYDEDSLVNSSSEAASNATSPSLSKEDDTDLHKSGAGPPYHSSVWLPCEPLIGASASTATRRDIAVKSRAPAMMTSSSETPVSIARNVHTTHFTLSHLSPLDGDARRTVNINNTFSDDMNANQESATVSQEKEAIEVVHFGLV